MAKKTAPRKVQVILVDANGTVKPEVTVKPRLISTVKWLPEIEGESIQITFDDPNDLPFSDWTSGPTRNGSSVTGKLKDRTGKKSFSYTAKGFQRRGHRPVANPQLIVDGGGR